MKNQIVKNVPTIKHNFWIMATVLVCGLVLSVGFWKPLHKASARTVKPATSGNFKIKFDYSKAEHPELFTDKVKAEIESSGQLLAGFIGNNHEVTMIVVSDEKMSGAFASAAPSEWQEGTEENPIEKPLVTKGGIRFNAATLRKSGSDDGSSNVALTVHELFHALGFTTGTKAFNGYVKNGQFMGPMAMKMNGGKPVPLSGSHFPQNFKDPVGVEPRMNNGGGNSFFSAVELGILADIGYEIPVLEGASGPMFLNYNLDERYADKQSDNSFLLDGTGGNDIIYAGKGKFKIRGAGGNDVLVSGDGDTQMYGDDDSRMPEEYRSGKDGKDTFVIKDKKHIYQVHDLAADDVLLISPSVGVTMEEMEEAIKDPEKFTLNRTGGYLLQVGDFKIIIGTKDGKKLTSLENVKIEDWSAN